MALKKIKIRTSAATNGSNRCSKSATRHIVGLYRDITNILAEIIWAMSQGGVVIEMWVVIEYGKEICHNFYPTNFSPACKDFPIKLSKSWWY